MVLRNEIKYITAKMLHQNSLITLLKGLLVTSRKRYRCIWKENTLKKKQIVNTINHEFKILDKMIG